MHETSQRTIDSDTLPPTIPPILPLGGITFLPPAGNLSEWPKKPLTLKEMLDVAKAHSASSSVARVTKLHAYLIANGICGKRTRSCCLFALLSACSFHSVRIRPIGHRQYCSPDDLDVTVFHIGDIEDGMLTAAHIAGYALQTLRALGPLLAVPPRPISNALFKSQALLELGLFNEGVGLNSVEARDFPSSICTGRTPSLELPREAECPDFYISTDILESDERLHAIYYNIVQLHNAYCGDESNVNEIDQGRMRGIARALDCDIVDDVASILSQWFALSAIGGKPKQLTFRSSDVLSLPLPEPVGGVAEHMYKKLAPEIFRGTNGAIAAENVPRYLSVPKAVKSKFRSPTDEFFLIFLLEVNSSSLVEALSIRLSIRLGSGLSAAAGGKNDTRFSTQLGIVESMAKSLSVVFHMQHWTLLP